MFDWLRTLFTEQVLGPIISVAITALLTWIAVQYQRITGRQLEAAHRIALQSALENGIRGAIQMLLKGKLNVDGTVPEEKKIGVLAEAAKYVEKSVPDAVKVFKLDHINILDLLKPHMPIAHDNPAPPK